MTSKMKNKTKQKPWAGEMAQQLCALAALLEGLNMVPTSTW